jgi:hypothetical protein
MGNYMFALAIRYPALSSIPIFHILFASMIIGCLLNIDTYKLRNFPVKADRYFFYFIMVICVGLILRSDFSILIDELMVPIPILALFFLTGSLMVGNLKELKIVVKGFLLIIVLLGVEGVFFPLSFVDLENLYEGAELYKAIQTYSLEGLVSLKRFVGVGRFDNSNEVALIMNMVMPFLLFRMMKGRKNLSWYCAILAFFITSFLTMKTLSRAGFLGYIAMLSYFVFSKKEKTKKIAWAVILVCIMIPLLSTSFLDRIGTISISERDRSAEGRITAWREGVDVIKFRPFLGLGKGNWKDYHGLQPHNSIVLVMAETGLLGLYFWGMLIIFAFKKLKRIEAMSLDRNESEICLKQLATALKMAMVGFLVTAFFGNQCYNPLFYLFMGLPIGMERIAKNMIASSQNDIIKM